MSEAAFDPSV
jgi:hypothetical protein